MEKEMLKKRIILILLLISLITNVSVFATDVDTDGNTTTGEIVSPPTENTVTGKQKFNVWTSYIKNIQMTNYIML